MEKWCRLWREIYCKPAVKDTTAEYCRSCIENHIVPNIGTTKLEKLTTLDQAVKERLIPCNPALGCRLPPKEKKEMQILPAEEIGVP